MWYKMNLGFSQLISWGFIRRLNRATCSRSGLAKFDKNVGFTPGERGEVTDGEKS